MPDFDEAIAAQNASMDNVPPPELLTENQKRAVNAHVEYHEKMAALATDGSGEHLFGGGLTLRAESRASKRQRP